MGVFMGKKGGATSIPVNGKPNSMQRQDRFTEPPYFISTIGFHRDHLLYFVT